ncbi:SDR family NAD(P)-dependent oxidoreductase [Bradyrhizobium sp. GCM10023182]|uniref:SDR family NAD(P)-dependent oxidoreductase n=1 Tax=Bradyrhizobium zhengyangense TaxID=2911009 RepID=A0ABS9LQL0_9BRAD|nr:SDR family NAD(P)-dependent oxidoreductase [Bradyrhizobium zhengyangense]MCG2669291.1 SDR family NAD(P)-dependent oxidoreductase [Bradyrhizobium zhengyangense]
MSVVKRRTLLVTGMAEGLGADIATTFAQGGYDVLGLSRTGSGSEQIGASVARAGGSYTHLACDLTNATDVQRALQPIGGTIDVLIHNAQVLMIRPFGEISPQAFEEVWRVACFGAMLSAQAVLPHVAARRSGTMIFSGATAGLRGGANFAAFASAKFALRGLAQALAREFGPMGVHVAHVVIDGLIDAPKTDQRFGAATTGRMDANAIAQAYLQLTAQPPSAWTQEMDLRPFAEKF